jgi:membrane-bound ClpP family serine protease
LSTIIFDIIWAIFFSFEGLILLGIILIVIGISLIVFDILLYGIIFLILGVIIIIAGGLGSHFQAKRKLRKKYTPQFIVYTELEEKIYKYLKNNENKAFTTNAIMNKLFSDSLAEVSKELVEQSLENLVKKGIIQLTQKDAEIFYLYR